MKSRKRQSRLLKPLLMGESRNPRGPLKRLPGVSHYARFILIGKSKQATEPVARKLRDIKGLKVRHFKTTLIDIRDSYRAAGMLLKGYFSDGANSLALRTKITDYASRY